MKSKAEGKRREMIACSEPEKSPNDNSLIIEGAGKGKDEGERKGELESKVEGKRKERRSGQMSFRNDNMSLIREGLGEGWARVKIKKMKTKSPNR